jgi:hypothetical protein
VLTFQNTLTYTCICSDGTEPDVVDYEGTLPYFICEESYSQCVSNNSNDVVSQRSCKTNIESKCGTKLLDDKVNASFVDITTTPFTTTSQKQTQTKSTTKTSETSSLTAQTTPESSTSVPNASQTSSDVAPAASPTAPGPSGGLTPDAKIGLGVGVGVGVPVLFGLLVALYFLRSRRTGSKSDAADSVPYPGLGVSELGRGGYHEKAELYTTEAPQELGTDKRHETAEMYGNETWPEPQVGVKTAHHGGGGPVPDAQDIYRTQ